MNKTLSGRILAIGAVVGGLALLMASLGTASANNQAPKFFIHPPPQPKLNVKVWTDRNQYPIGSNLRLFVQTSKQAYVYILDYDTQGQMRLLFPNQYSRNNLIGPGIYRLPDGPYQFRVVGPRGTEYIQAIATTQKINIYQFVKHPNQPYKEGPFPLVPDPGKLKQKVKSKLKAEFYLQIGGKKPKFQFKIVPVEWDSDWTTFQVGPKVFPNQNPQAQFTYRPSRPKVGQRVTFDATNSYDPDGYITSYKWDFESDGITDAWGRVVTHRFHRSGRFWIKLTVRDDQGATNSTTKIVGVGIAPRRGLNTEKPASFESNGDWIGNWYWCRQWNHYAEWEWDPIFQKARKAYINFSLLVTNKVNGGSGYSATVQVKILNSWGNVVETGVVKLDNPFRPQFPRNTGRIGYKAYGAYRIRNTSVLQQGFKVKLEWPPTGSRYHFAARRSGALLAYTY